MDCFNIFQLCQFCKRGSHVFRIKLSQFDDVTGKVNINPIEMIHFSFQCQFCRKTSIVNFGKVCPPSCVLFMKHSVKEKKVKIQELVQQLLSLVFEE